MLKIKLESETANDSRTPINIANAVIDIFLGPTSIDKIETSKDIENKLVCLEELADHILLYVNAHRRMIE